MFNLKAKFMLAAAVLFIGGVSAANAQLVNGSSIKVNVPETFVVRGEKFSAGTYIIERTPSTVDSPSLLIIRGEGQTMVFDTILSSSNAVAKNTQLVFDAVNGVNYLSAIIVKGQSTRNELAKSKAQTSTDPDTVAIRYVITLTDIGF